MLPDEGRGELRTESANGSHRTELEITSPEEQRRRVLPLRLRDRPDGSGVAWSSYRWRGEEKSKRERVRGEDVVDVAAGDPPHPRAPAAAQHALRIWSDGKVYPVLVSRVAAESMTVPAGTFRADHYRVRGQRISGERFWKGGMDLWLAQDEARTPVRIQVERGFANVRLDLVNEN